MKTDATGDGTILVSTGAEYITVSKPVQLRWFIGPAATRLQFLDGERWVDVPTVHYGKEISQRYEVGP